MNPQMKLAAVALAGLIVGGVDIGADPGSCAGGACGGSGGAGWVLTPPNCDLSAGDIAYLADQCLGAMPGQCGFSFGYGSGSGNDYAICSCGSGCSS